MIFVIIRRISAGIAATRYITATCIYGIALAYGLLHMFGWLPHTTHLSEQLGIQVSVLLATFGGGIWFIWIFIWAFFVASPTSSNDTQRAFRSIYRQTDVAGTTALNLIAIIIIAIVVIIAISKTNIQRDILVFMSVVAGLPILMDFLPAHARRFVARSFEDSSHADTLLSLTEIISGNSVIVTQRQAVISALIAYNDLNQEFESAKLPSGQLIEIPPKVLAMLQSQKPVITVAPSSLPNDETLD